MPKPKWSYAYGANGAGKTAEQWFWEGVEVLPDPDACWMWKRKSKSIGGYGLFKGKPAHRFSFALVNGPIPKGLLICHKCDQPACVNPRHLFAGTQKDNMADCKRKNRHRGRSPKLKASEVVELRKLRSEGVPFDDLETKFKLNRASLYEAAVGKTYQWVK